MVYIKRGCIVNGFKLTLSNKSIAAGSADLWGVMSLWPAAVHPDCLPGARSSASMGRQRHRS